MIDEWARQWGVSPAAVADLRRRMGIDGEAALYLPDTNQNPSHSESNRQSLIREAAANSGVWLTRNNVGALLDDRGIPVRYGLANESPAQNKAVKSGDLVGMESVLIGPHHVGQLFARFVSVECKKQGWQFNAKDKHERAQLAWANFVVSKGGKAFFCSEPTQFIHQMRG